VTKLDAGPYWGNEGIDPSFTAVQRLASDYEKLRAEVKRLRAALEAHHRLDDEDRTQTCDTCGLPWLV